MYEVRYDYGLTGGAEQLKSIKNALKVAKKRLAEGAVEIKIKAQGEGENNITKSRQKTAGRNVPL